MEHAVSEDINRGKRTSIFPLDLLTHQIAIGRRQVLTRLKNINTKLYKWSKKCQVIY